MSEEKYSPIGRDWDDVRKELYTPEENAASDARASIMCALIEARQKKSITQQKLEELSGVRQPVIARMENGVTSPQLDTVLKVLAPLGKTLYVGDISPKYTQVKVKQLSQKYRVKNNSKEVTNIDLLEKDKNSSK